MTDRDDPGHFLKYWRKLRGLTQSALANRAGTVQQHVAKLENGERQLQPNTGQRFAEALGINLRQLYFGPDEPTDEEVAMIRVIRRLPPARRNALMEITGALEENAAPFVPPPDALVRAAEQTGESIGGFDPKLWEDLDQFAEGELAGIAEIGRTTIEQRTPIVATLYLLAQKDAAAGLKPDYARFRLFIHGQAHALRAAGRRRPQA